MNKVYSAKISTLNEFGHKRIDEEGIYSSFEKAFDFLTSSFFNNPEVRELKLYRFDITEIEMDSDKVLTVWEYNCKGELLNSTKQARLKSKYLKTDFEEGEIIRLRVSEHWDFSDIDSPILAVISRLPIPGIQESKFTVDYISNLGFLDHSHVELERIEKLENDVPDEYEFLKILSSHYKNEISIRDEHLMEMRSCNMYLKNIKSYKELNLSNQ